MEAVQDKRLWYLIAAAIVVALAFAATLWTRNATEMTPAAALAPAAPITTGAPGTPATTVGPATPATPEPAAHATSVGPPAPPTTAPSAPAKQ